MADESKALDLNALNDRSCEDLLTLARIAEAAERYDDMCKFMKKLVELKCSEKNTLSLDERNLLSVAYKNVVGAKRQSWRTLTSQDFPDVNEDVKRSYKELVEVELDEVCNEVLTLLKEGPVSLIGDDAQPEDAIFYLKMCGDYYRYLAEFSAKQDHKENTEKYYKDAFEKAKTSLPETHPTRLGLALNFSVAYYEILKKKDDACKLAKEAFDAAIEKLDTLNDASYKDSTLIMQLLRDNLTLWTSEQGGDEDAEA